MIVDRDQRGLGAQLGDMASGTREWHGLGRFDLGPLRVIVARDRVAFRRWTRGLVPDWSAGVTIPDRRTIVVRVDAADPFQTMQHELAHMALHRQVTARLPRWFDEGYAVLAAREFGRVEGLRLNLAVAVGRMPTLRELDGALLGGEGEAGAAYALAGSAVGTLARLHPEGSLEPFLRELVARQDFPATMTAMGYRGEQFEVDWHRILRREYNLGIWLITGGAWVIFTILLGAGVAWRRYQDRPRREALDVGWELPPDDTGITTSPQSPETLDPARAGH